MTIPWKTGLRRASGPAMLAMLALALVGCNVEVGFSSTSSGSLDGRTPASFEVACAEIGGFMLEAEDNTENQAESTCTMPNGDQFACDWAAQRCSAACSSTAEECARLRSMGYVPLMLQKTPTPTPGMERTSAEAFGGL